MKKVLFAIIIILGLNYLNVNALNECTSAELNRLKEIANNITFKYNYEIDSSDDYIETWYNFEIINNSEDVKIYYKTDNMSLKEEFNSSIYFPEKDKVSFYIYAYSMNMCSNKLLRTETITLPVYNQYYYFNKDKCKQNPDFKYCNEFMDIGDLSNEEIDKLFNDYNKNEDNNFIKVEDIKNNYLIYIFGFIALLIFGFSLYKIIKKDKQNDLKR